MRVVVFLQNAWSPVYAGSVWPRPSWLAALGRSRSGQRLRLLIDDFSCCHNTTASVAEKPSGVCPSDPEHIRSILAAESPTVVVACGKQSLSALARLWDGPLMALPHPAYRVLTDELYRSAREKLANGFGGRMSAEQKRDGILWADLAADAAGEEGQTT